MGTKSIQDLAEEQDGKTVTLTIMKGTNTISFESKIIEIIDDCMIIEAIRHEDKVIGFDARGMVINAQVDCSPLPIKFSRVSVDAVKYNDEVCHRIKSSKDGYEVNRREHFRVFIGKSGMAQINQHKKAREVLVKDVSGSGFAIICKDDLDADNAHIRLNYKDDDTNIVLLGEVVRKEILPDERVLYGCKLLREPNGLGGYLNRKQIEKRNM